MFGNVAFGHEVDMWALGLTVAEVAGVSCHRFAAPHAKHSAHAFIVGVMQQVGAPPAALFDRLPLWRAGYAFEPTPWPIVTQTILGTCGLDFVEQALRWDHVRRLTAARALEHAYVNPMLTTSAGLLASSAAPWQGKRHAWYALACQMQGDVLGRLRADPVLAPDTIRAALGLRVRPDRTQ